MDRYFLTFSQPLKFTHPSALTTSFSLQLQDLIHLLSISQYCVQECVRRRAEVLVRLGMGDMEAAESMFTARRRQKQSTAPVEDASATAMHARPGAGGEAEDDVTRVMRRVFPACYSDVSPFGTRLRRPETFGMLAGWAGCRSSQQG